MLCCRDLTELVTEYLERRLALWDRLRFQMHVVMCGHCRAYLKQMQVTVDALGEMPDEPIPDDVREQLLQQFRTWERDS